MTSIPNSFSMDELSNMLENAPQEEDLHTCADNNDKQELTPEYIQSVAQECLELAAKKCKDPLVHKVMAMMIISRMVEWHNQCAETQLQDGSIQSAAAWYRDAGKFQSMMDSLFNITVGPDDFTCTDE